MARAGGVGAGRPAAGGHPLIPRKDVVCLILSNLQQFSINLGRSYLGINQAVDK